MFFITTDNYSVWSQQVLNIFFFLFYINGTMATKVLWQLEWF